MSSKKKKEALDEEKILTRCVFEGKTLIEIAKILHKAKSSISYKLVKLFKKYNAKNRHEFIINIFCDVIEKYKKQLKEKNEELEFLNKKIKQEHTNQ